jgi:uncharacterized membrane protein YebE (DUF533 family)
MPVLFTANNAKQVLTVLMSVPMDQRTPTVIWESIRPEPVFKPQFAPTARPKTLTILATLVAAMAANGHAPRWHVRRNVQPTRIA